MIDPRENQEVYQRALAWVGEQITAAERQGLTLDYLGGWHTYKPDPKTLERALAEGDAGVFACDT
jgi:hypothetical protein